VWLLVSFKLVFEKQNIVCSDYNLLFCQQYIHTFNTDGSVNKYTYSYLTCDIQLTVYIVSIAIATITSVTEFKIVKRFQTFFYNTELSKLQFIDK
jgi:hypothetical protein